MSSHSPYCKKLLDIRRRRAIALSFASYQTVLDFFVTKVSTGLYLDDHLGNLIDALEVGRDEGALKVALRTFTTRTGFNRFVYADMRAGDVRSYSDYPQEWQRRYLSRNYIALDPVVSLARRTMQPTAWSIDDRNQYTPEERNVVEEASDFGIASGLMVPIRSGFGRTALLALASDSPKAAQLEVRDAAFAATAVTYVHINLLGFSDRKGAVTDIPLTPREQACLTWASLGKTMAETAWMIGITERTVRGYLDDSRRKLGAVNIAHAVRVAGERGLL